MTEPVQPRNDGVFLRVATLATMFCFGLFGLIVQALQKTPTGVAFVWSGMSVAAFLAGTALGWLYWLIVGRVLTSPSSRTGRSRFLACSLPIVVAALAAYVFIPLKLTGGEKLKEIFIGLVLASLALGVVGFAMWRVIKFLNEDQEQQQKKDE